MNLINYLVVSHREDCNESFSPKTILKLKIFEEEKTSVFGIFAGVRVVPRRHIGSLQALGIVGAGIRACTSRSASRGSTPT